MVLSELLPLSVLNMVSNLDGLGPSILSSIKWIDIFLIIPSIFYGFYYGFTPQKHFDKKDWCGVVISILFVLVVITSPYTIRKKDNGYIQGMFFYEPLRGYSEFGLINYWIVQCSYLRGCSDKEITFANSF